MRLCGSGNMIGSSHDPCTMKGSSNAGAAVPLVEIESRLAVPLRSRSRAGIETEPPDASPLHAHLFDIRYALVDSQIDGERFEGCFAGAELAAARQRSALDALEQLFHVESSNCALAAGEARRPVQCLGQPVNAVPGTIERDAEIALALEPANAEQVTETLLQIDVGELQLRLEVGAGRRFGDPERSPDHAAEGLRLADCDCEIAVAQIGCHRGAPEFGVGDVDASGRQLEVELDPLEAVERNRLGVPSALAAAEQTHGGDVGRQVEPLRGKGSLQALARVEGQHAFAGIAVELDIDAGKGDGP